LRYALWSHGRLLGHTQLDLDTHQDRFIHGFIEPTPVGEQVLPDATGVADMCGRTRSRREDGELDREYLKAFQAAVDGREALDLRLEDENGELFEHDFIRVYNLRGPMYSEDALEDEEDELDPELLEESDDLTEFKAEMEEDLRLIAESHMYGSSWSPPPDERWDTMKYYVQVFLTVPEGYYESLTE
jgi:hypothetical protein